MKRVATGQPLITLRLRVVGKPAALGVGRKEDSVRERRLRLNLWAVGGFQMFPHVMRIRMDGLFPRRIFRKLSVLEHRDKRKMRAR